MGTSARRESLVGILEVADGPGPIPKAHFGSEPALRSRSHNLHRLSQLGPPDIVYVRKRFTPVIGASKVCGFYHFVRGVDVSSAATISAYIVSLVTAGLDAQSWVNSGSWEIIGATYRSYNAISRLDVVVDLELPGGVTAHAIDADEKRVELNDHIWRETAVCAALRDLSGAGEHPLYPCLRVIPSPPERPEEAVLESAAACVANWPASGCDDSAHIEPSVANSRIAAAISENVLALCRYDDVTSFFTSDLVRAAGTDCVVHAAAAYRLKNDLGPAMSLIDSAIEIQPDSSMAWVGKAKILAARGDLQEACDAAKRASECSKVGLSTWITLADLYADLKRYEAALVALNSGDMPQLELDYYLRELVPNRRNTTTPTPGASGGCDAVRVLANRLREERNLFNSKSDEVLNDLPGKLMTKSEHECYAVLVKILTDVGWDDLLAIRGNAFVMETDIEEAESSAKKKEDASDSEDEQPEVVVDSALSRDEKVPSENGKPNGSLTSAPEDGANGASELEGVELADVPISAPNGNVEENGDLSEEERRKKSVEQSGKIVCKPWLDYLVTIMYEDLRAMAFWNADERASIASSSTKSSAANNEDADVEAAEEPPRRTPDEIVATNRKPAVDWLRRGDLALRLQKTEEARTAFWVCVKISEKAKAPAITALVNLMEMAAKEGDAATTFRCVDSIWTYLDAACDRKSSSKTTAPVMCVRRAIYNLIAKLGLRKVREVLSRLDVDRNRIDTILLDAVSCSVHGVMT